MSLIHPLLAWGALLGAIPIIIHILSRRRYKVIRWAATDFLRQALAEQSRNVKLQDLILLALRTLVLILAAFAIARPVLSQSALQRTGLHVRGPDGVIIIDTSYSMAAIEAAEQRLDDARQRAHAIVASMTPQTQMGVIHMSAEATGATEGLTADRVAIGSAIDRASISATGADLAGAVSAAMEMLSGSTAPRKRIYLITDAQSRLFEASQEAIHKLFTDADESIGVVVLTVGDEIAANAAVTDLRIASRWLGVGQAAQVEARVKDFGTVRTGSTGVELWVDGRKVERRTVTLEDGAADVVFNHTFTSGGVFDVEVRLDPDALETDNRRFAAVCVPEAMPVAVVEPERDERFSAHTFLSAALNASPDAPLTLPPFEVGGRWPAQRLADGIDRDTWVLVLADPGALPAQAGEQLLRFAERGGALLVTLGPEATSTMGAFRGGPRMPGWLANVDFDMTADDTVVVHPDMKASPLVGADGWPVLDVDSPGMREAYESVQVFRAVTLAPETDDGWAVPLRLTDGRPLLITRSIGDASRMAVLATSLDGRWCDVVYRPAMVPMVQDVLSWLVRSRLVAGTIQPREVFVPISGEKIITPDGKSFALSGFQVLDDQGEQLGIRFDRTDVPGVYHVIGGDEVAGALKAVAVNVDTGESEPGRWTPARIDELFPQGRCDVLDAGNAVDAIALAGLSGSEIWPMLAALLAALLILEAYLAFRFGFTQGADRGGRAA